MPEEGLLRSGQGLSQELRQSQDLRDTKDLNDLNEPFPLQDSSNGV